MEKINESQGKELPTGLGEKQLSRNRETLPAVEVSNIVEWVNNDFPELPIDIRKGEATKLGLFLSAGIQDAGQKIYDLEIKPFHARSGILGRVIFRDKENRLYRDIDLKGIGHNYLKIDLLNSIPLVLINIYYPQTKRKPLI